MVRVVLTNRCLVQQKPGRRVSSKVATPRLPSSVPRKHSAKNPTSSELISDDVIFSDESKLENQMQSEERSFHERLYGFDASRSPSSNTITDNASYFCAAPHEYSLDPTQRHIEQLAKLIIAIGRSVSNLSRPARRPSLSASSPSFNDICASASSLIMIATQVSQTETRENELDLSMLEPDSHLSPILAFDYLPSHPLTDEPVGQGVLLNPGTLLMILACYQRLLEAFETICLFMQQRLHEMEMNSLIGFNEQRWSRSISPPSLSPPSDTLQFIMMIKLTSDLLSRLDHALAPLVASVDSATSHGLNVAGHPCHDFSPGSSASSSSSSSTGQPSSRDSSDRMPAVIIGDVTTESDRTGCEVAETRSTSNKLIMKGGEQLRQQQSRLRSLIKVVKRLVRSQKV